MPVKSVSVLFIDLGNSRAKWQLREQGRVLSQGAEDYDDVLTEKLPQADKVLAASVRAHDEVHHQLTNAYGGRLTWLSEPLDSPALMQHCYADPSRLGVDRWLSMLGARFHHKGDVLVVDAGTALTADLLSADNCHKGGFIIPGLTLSANALFQNTGRVRRYDNEENAGTVQPGTNTLSCVMQGSRRQLLSFVASLSTDFPRYTLVVTGGDGRWLSEELNLTYYPDLVFDGMDSLCAGSFLPL